MPRLGTTTDQEACAPLCPDTKHLGVPVRRVRQYYSRIRAATMMHRTLATPFGLTVIFLVQLVPQVRAQDAAAWAADVDTLVASIRRIHPDPYRLYQPSAWDSVAAVVKSRLQSLSPHAAAFETQRLLAMAGDGHTEWAVLPESLRGRWLPLIFRRFEEGWFVRTGHPSYHMLFGKPITRWAGVPIHEAVERVLPYVPGENVVGKLDDAANFLRVVKVLDALGMTAGIPESVSVSVLESDGSETTIAVGATEESWVRPSWIDVDKLLFPDVPEPLYRRLDGNYACAWLPDARLLYVVFNQTRDEDDSSIAEFFGGVYDFARRTEPNKFVLDIRENSGGNLDLNGPVVRGLIATSFLDQPGRFFVVIGPDTYSAAMNLAVQLERYTHALFVGSPTGATPNHFGDTRIVELPNSGIRAEISELYWQNSDPRDARPWITPDLPATPSAAAFIVGRDPALEAILGFQATNSLVERFGSPAARWRRASQLQTERWPALVAPAARPLALPQVAPQQREEECIPR